MKRKVSALSSLAFAALAPLLLAQEPVIKIDDIDTGNEITGKVSNLANPKDHAILVYVKTNHWHIHPYADQGEDLSWTRINEDGTWTLSTVQRPYRSRSVAALVVDPAVADQAPAELTSLSKIKKRAMIVYSKEELMKNGWYGKL